MRQVARADDTSSRDGADGRLGDDAELLARYRRGDKTVIEVFYERHRDRWRRVAWGLTRKQHDAEDLIAEALTRTIEALEKGAGPTDSFAAYVTRSMRNIHENERVSPAARRTRPTDDVARELDVAGVGAESDDAEIERLPDAQAVRDVFLTLPDNWREVLWHTEIEGKRPAEIAKAMGISANAVAAMAMRARNGLRRAYIARELARGDGECADYRGEVVARAEGHADFTPAFEAHAHDCDACAGRLVEAKRLGENARTLVVPALLFLGAGARRAAAATATGPPAATGVAAGKAWLLGAAALLTIGCLAGGIALISTFSAPEPAAGGTAPPSTEAPSAATPIPDASPFDAASPDLGLGVEATAASSAGATLWTDTRWITFDSEGKATVQFDGASSARAESFTLELSDGATLESADGWRCAKTQENRPTMSCERGEVAGSLTINLTGPAGASASATLASA